MSALPVRYSLLSAGTSYSNSVIIYLQIISIGYFGGVLYAQGCPLIRFSICFKLSSPSSSTFIHCRLLVSKVLALVRHYILFIPWYRIISRPDALDEIIP